MKDHMICECQLRQFGYFAQLSTLGAAFPVLCVEELAGLTACIGWPHVPCITQILNLGAKLLGDKKYDPVAGKFTQCNSFYIKYILIQYLKNISYKLLDLK